MDHRQAKIIMQLLEHATGGDLQACRDVVEDGQWTAEEISAAWKELERIAGMVGCAPEAGDI